MQPKNTQNKALSSGQAAWSSHEKLPLALFNQILQLIWNIYMINFSSLQEKI
jgi:hypothetical protein